VLGASAATKREEEFEVEDDSRINGQVTSSPVKSSPVKTSHLTVL
jgi:hypothetical protein